MLLCELIHSVIFQNENKAFFNLIDNSCSIDAIYDNWSLALNSNPIFDQFKNIPLEKLISVIKFKLMI